MKTKDLVFQPRKKVNFNLLPPLFLGDQIRKIERVMPKEPFLLQGDTGFV